MRWLIVIAGIGCSKAERAPEVKPAEQAVLPGSVIDCTATLLEADVEAACGNQVDIARTGPGEKLPTCHRTFEGPRGEVSIIVGHEAQPNTQRQQFETLEQGTRAEAARRTVLRGLERVEGVGDAAFRYSEGIVKASPKILYALKGPRLITLRTNGVLGSRDEMCSHDQLADLARKVIARLPP